MKKIGTGGAIDVGLGLVLAVLFFPEAYRGNITFQYITMTFQVTAN